MAITPDNSFNFDEFLSDSDFGFTFSGSEEFEQNLAEVESECTTKMKALEKLIMPLLANLAKNPDKEYILWPNRKTSIETQAKKILAITRS
jgi:hypothetical protein